jgi:hypothetical protein
MLAGSAMGFGKINTWTKDFSFFSLSIYIMTISIYLYGVLHEPAHIGIIYNTVQLHNCTRMFYQSATETAIAAPSTAKDSLHGIRNEPALPTPLSTVSVDLPSI